MSRATLTLAVIVSCELMLMLDGTITNVALPEIRDGLGLSPGDLAWVSNAFLLSYGGLMLLGGRAGDVLGRRRVFTGGMALFTAASLLGGLAQDPAWLIAARAAQGVGAALAAPSTLALLTTNFDGPARTRALSVYSSVTASAMTLGLVLGGVITSTLSWRWVLLVNVPIGVLVVALTPRVVAESPRLGGRIHLSGRLNLSGRLDLTGALTSALGLAALTLGLARVGNRPLAIGLGVLLLAAFVLVERRAVQPVTPLRLFADRSRSSALLALLLIPMTTMSAQFLIVQYLQEALGWGALRAGLAFLPMALGMFVTARYAPRVMSVLSWRLVAVLGTVLMTGGLAWLCFLPETNGYATGVAGPLLLLGAGLGFVVVPFNMAIMSTVAPEDSGAAASLLQTAMLTGASMGIAVLSSVYTSSVDGRAATAPVIADGMGTAFTVATALAAAALLVVLAAFRTPAPPVPDAPREPAPAREDSPAA
ncbi:MFS transporter [Actinomadura oligospora]|uniref:MFS transporter n=1 Tax=Actinomadura oligospora TaxID=111804 RepID=UPI0004B7843A|nr:MFS transporter [Actinomadura oligospora]